MKKLKCCEYDTSALFISCLLSKSSVKDDLDGSIKSLFSLRFFKSFCSKSSLSIWWHMDRMIDSVNAALTLSHLWLIRSVLMESFPNNGVSATEKKPFASRNMENRLCCRSHTRWLRKYYLRYRLVLFVWYGD